MKVLIVGGGGRESAVVRGLKENKDIHKIYCAPGNAGIEDIAECVPINPADIEGMFLFAQSAGIEYTVVSMDEPLALGIVDRFRAGGLKILGPTREAAKLEWSKSFAKSFMKKYNIPTAKHTEFSCYDKALGFLEESEYPLVVKADGLAVGKGVFICETRKQAENALKVLFLDKQFGISGENVVIEEYLDGVETTVMAFCDGKTIVPMVSAKDHKRIYDGDLGPNTGGMGVISPSPHYSDEVAAFCGERIFKPTISGLNSEGIDFRGVIYFELMITRNGVFVLEYNSRFGDPEAQAVIPRLKTDLFTVLKACEDGTLAQLKIEWDAGASACVIIASGGYPGAYEKGYPITGIACAEACGAIVYHAGTKKTADGVVVTGGGRVLAVTSLADTVPEAVKKAYGAVKCISFKDMYYRQDIGGLL